MVTDNIELVLLTAQDSYDSRKQQATEVARRFSDFVGNARRSVHIAIYDFRLEEGEARIVIDALSRAAASGIDVRVAYFQTRPRTRKAAHGGDRAPGPDEYFLKQFHKDVQVKAVKGIRHLPPDVKALPIEGGGHLMHSKYIVVDGCSVWMGSANFTTDAWSIQDNNIVILESPDIAEYYETDFNELWQSGRIAGTGKDDHGNASIDGVRVEVDFAPGDGAEMDQGIADLILSAENEIVIASMVISSGNVLSALADAIKRGVQLGGVYDGPEMNQVARVFGRGKNGASKTKLELWNIVKHYLVAKHSTPYSDDGPHDFMHNKLMVVDRHVVKTGSFNFSSNATRNAESMITIYDREIADEYAQYVRRLAAKYKGAEALSCNRHVQCS
ncbi:MAG: phosphatidylserine/phosphatidylglycerophosphate/cardiolipin synthase family protein [Nitrospirae bacterium]|nr:phosphatidylserine/phosphatidylglycerophosphate/cardiolipin synthase family protein [Nitrospirota bacterium]